MTEQRNNQRGWQTSGMETEHGLYHTGEYQAIGIPADVRLEGTRIGPVLRWRARDPQRRARIVLPGPGMLDSFVRLSDAPDQQILHYASQWGVLGICEHGLPYSHNPPTGELWKGHRPCYPMEVPKSRSSDGLGLYESVSDWRCFSRAARGLLNIAARLHFQKVGEREDWRAVFSVRPEFTPLVPYWKQGVGTDGFFLTCEISEWLRWGDVRSRPYWERGASSLRTGGGGLFGALALQILYAVNKVEGFVMCSGCGGEFIPRRRPNPNRRAYCDACRSKGVPERDASHAYRTRRSDLTKRARSPRRSRC